MKPPRMDHSWWVRLTLWLNLVWALGLVLCSLLCVFFYQTFAEWMGQPYDGLLRMSPVLMRSVFLAGALFYMVPAWACWRMRNGIARGFWLYAVPALMVFGAALVFVFNILNLVQVFLYAGSLLVLANRRRPAEQKEVAG